MLKNLKRYIKAMLEVKEIPFKIAVIRTNIAGTFTIRDIPKQNVKVDYLFFDEKNLPFPLPNVSNRLKYKFLKMQTHRFLPDYDLYIWIDGSVRVNGNNFVETFLEKLEDYDMVMYKHLLRKNVYEEVYYINDEVNKGTKYLLPVDYNESLIKEALFYKEKGVPEDFPLFNSAVFLRRNNKKVNRAFDEWWNRYFEYSNFDQAMFSYVAWKEKLNINMLVYEDVRTDKLFKREFHINYKSNDLIPKEDFLKLVKNRLELKQPFAFVRYSDGEIMLLNNKAYYKEYINIIKKLWGYEPSNEEINDLSSYLIASLKQADIIGFPTPRHRARDDYFSKTEEVFNEHIGKTVLSTTTLASIDVGYELLYDDKYGELLQGLDTLNYISCRNIDEQLKKKYNIKNVNSFIIAPEPKFTSGYEGERHYPNQFVKIREWIKTIDCKGHLCLVGGGAPSKIYNIWFKEQGGISLDIGAVFDLWYGKKTRGLGRGVDVDFNDYKL